MKTKKLVLSGAFIALYVVLSYLTIDLRVMKISFAGLPVIIGSMLFGPVFGLQIGLIGELLGQLLRYGVTATTFLWIIPPAVRGWMVGSYAMRRNFNLTIKQMGWIIICSAVVVTILNTGGIYIDSKIYGYYSFAYVFGAVFVRLLTGIATSIIYLAIVPFLLSRLVHLRSEYLEKKSF